MVKRMDFNRQRVLLTVSVLSILVVAAIMNYAPPKEQNPENPLNLQFPSGIPSNLGTVSATQQDQQQYNTISVTGSGTASAQANEATVTLGVQTQAGTASEAIRLNAELMTAVIDAIKVLGLTDDDMKTVSYNVYPVYAKDSYNLVIGYRTVNMIAVEITDMDLIGEVIDTAAENGANVIQGVSFGLSDENREDLKRQAYLAALGDAESKAELIAERLNLTITGVLYVSESVYQPYQPYYDYRISYAGETAPSTPIIEGRLSVSVTVHVIYAFT